MATYQVTYWQEIPSQVDAKASGEKPAKQMLSHRFQELIDIIAVKRKLDASDDYINQWTKGPKTEKSGSAAEVVTAMAAELEAQFEQIRATALQNSQHAKSE